MHLFGRHFLVIACLTMFHIVESCPLRKLNGSLSLLHSADEEAVLWLTSSWHAYRLAQNQSFPVTVTKGGNWGLLRKSAVELTTLAHPFCVNQAEGDLPRHFYFMGEYSKLDRVKKMGTRGKINAIWWNIKVIVQKLVDICEYVLPTNLQNFTQKDLTEVRIFQTILGGGYFFLKHPVNPLDLLTYLLLLWWLTNCRLGLLMDLLHLACRDVNLEQLLSYCCLCLLRLHVVDDDVFRLSQSAVWEAQGQ